MNQIPWIFYLPLAIGIIVFFRGLIIAEVHKTENLATRELRITWASFGLSLVYYGALIIYFEVSSFKIPNPLVGGLLIILVGLALSSYGFWAGRGSLERQTTNLHKLPSDYELEHDSPKKIRSKTVDGRSK